MMSWIGDATIFLKIVTALFAAGFLHSIAVSDWKLAAYYFFAAGLQVVIILMGK